MTEQVGQQESSYLEEQGAWPVIQVGLDAADRPYLLNPGAVSPAGGTPVRQTYYPADHPAVTLDEEAIRADVEAKLEARLLSEEAVEAAEVEHMRVWGMEDDEWDAQGFDDGESYGRLMLKAALRAALSAQEKAEEVGDGTGN